MSNKSDALFLKILFVFLTLAICSFFVSASFAATGIDDVLTNNQSDGNDSVVGSLAFNDNNGFESNISPINNSVTPNNSSGNSPGNVGIVPAGSVTNLPFVFVDPLRGSNGNIGNNSSAALLTLEEAYRCVASGGIIYLLPGVYTGTANRLTAIAKPVNIMGYTHEGGEVIFSGFTTTIFTITNAVANNTNISNITVVNSTGVFLDVNVGDSILNITVKDCTFANISSSATGFTLFSSSAAGKFVSTVNVIGCTFFNIRYTGTFGNNVITSIFGGLGVGTASHLNCYNSTFINIYNLPVYRGTSSLKATINFELCSFINNTVVSANAIIDLLGTAGANAFTYLGLILRIIMQLEKVYYILIVILSQLISNIIVFIIIFLQLLLLQQLLLVII
ncbi:MAG: hypothetical protein FWE58_04310 [Methanobrevibacter sp.]|nr:hypothetical protein [Methanobrevibacter sp.]